MIRLLQKSARFTWNSLTKLTDFKSAQYPNLRQNTANFKINYGHPHRLELDFDVPYIAIYRSSTAVSSSGIGDADFGIKWNFHSKTSGSHFPACSASLYVELPTGSPKQQLGSGLFDYWLNFIAQQPFTTKTRLNANLGVLFAGNTSTGVVGVDTTRGHVYTGGISILHDFDARFTIGGEIYGGVADTPGLGRKQLQGMVGGQINLRPNLALTLGLIVGKYEASPQIGGQIGLAMDLPVVFRPSTLLRFAVR